LYGKVVEIPQKETTPFYPRSPYGIIYYEWQCFYTKLYLALFTAKCDSWSIVKCI